jgi:predicted dinucleotide-binding enzyme
MGNPIARHLINAGHEVTVNDKRQEATANLVELGASWADHPQAVAESADVIFTSLPGPPEVDEAAKGIHVKRGVLEAVVQPFEQPKRVSPCVTLHLIRLRVGNHAPEWLGNTLDS